VKCAKRHPIYNNTCASYSCDVRGSDLVWLVDELKLLPLASEDLSPPVDEDSPSGMDAEFLLYPVVDVEEEPEYPLLDMPLLDEDPPVEPPPVA
jgi:hypothetical protein